MLFREMAALASYVGANFLTTRAVVLPFIGRRTNQSRLQTLFWEELGNQVPAEVQQNGATHKTCRR